MKNKDIAINHDSVGQKTVEHVDKITIAWKEPAKRMIPSHYTEPENSRDIG